MSFIRYILIIGILVACAHKVQVPLSETIVSKKTAENNWSQVLINFVDENGKIDFNSLSKRPLLLKRYISYLSINGPNKNPQQYSSLNSKKAFYINAYNALAMYGILLEGIRHRRGLPVHGQRTRTNARTRKGAKKTVAGKKGVKDMKH